MAIEAPPKILVEKYLIEIAKALNIDYEPDESVFEEERIRQEAAKRKAEAVLIDFNELHSDPMLPPQLPSTSNTAPPNLPTRSPSAGIVRPIGFDLSNSSLIEKEFESLNPTTATDDSFTKLPSQSPPPSYDAVSPPFSSANKPSSSNLSNNSANKSDLPNVPKTLPNTSYSTATGEGEEDIDFDDLAKRFESLKKN